MGTLPIPQNPQTQYLQKNLGGLRNRTKSAPEPHHSADMMQLWCNSGVILMRSWCGLCAALVSIEIARGGSIHGL